VRELRPHRLQVREAEGLAEEVVSAVAGGDGDPGAGPVVLEVEPVVEGDLEAGLFGGVDQAADEGRVGGEALHRGTLLQLPVDEAGLRGRDEDSGAVGGGEGRGVLGEGGVRAVVRAVTGKAAHGALPPGGGDLAEVGQGACGLPAGTVGAAHP
jgi:hypothetical protein